LAGANVGFEGCNIERILVGVKVVSDAVTDNPPLFRCVLEPDSVQRSEEGVAVVIASVDKADIGLSVRRGRKSRIERTEFVDAVVEEVSIQAWEVRLVRCRAEVLGKCVYPRDVVFVFEEAGRNDPVSVEMLDNEVVMGASSSLAANLNRVVGNRAETPEEVPPFGMELAPPRIRAELLLERPMKLRKEFLAPSVAGIILCPRSSFKEEVNVVRH
jgi:hypothetical protein